MHRAGFVASGLLAAGLVAGAGRAAAQVPKLGQYDTPDVHAQVDKLYPSAQVCGQCHPKQYEEWRVSSHAYADMSPMFNKFEQTINDLASGTIRYFCVRCHASVGTALGERRDISWAKRVGSAREGITCVSCHRVGESVTKTNGARRIAPGDINQPVFGPFDPEGVLEAIANADKWKIQVSPDEPDKPGYLRIHQQAIESPVITKSDLCVTCHQVQVHPGIKLEVVWEEYRGSPAFKAGITCQQCHMSKDPGLPSGFEQGPAAIVNGHTPSHTRPLTDHRFIGPGYPISHPGLFPLGNEGPFTPEQWLRFDWRAGWGTDEFEAKVAAAPGAYNFPGEWQKAEDRKQARAQVTANLAQWECRKQARLRLLDNGSRVDGPFFDSRPQVGKPLSFHYKVTSLNSGHNLPSGSLGAQPELWLNVALVDPDGKNIWESGYLDSNGDIADVHSRDVVAHKIPWDRQLFSLQTKFVTTNIKGTEREMYLPINLDVDQLPFIRPGSTPVSLLNHPPNVRLEKHSIPPLGSRDANYRVPGELMKKPGTYRLAVRMRGRSEPIYFMEFVQSTTEMKRSENEWITDSHKYAVEFTVR